VRVVTAATLWGVSGVSAQELFQHAHLRALWLVAVRIVVSAVVLVAWRLVHRERLGDLVGPGPRDLWTRTALFAIVGLLGVQATYFLAVATGSAVTATLLQFLSPIIILAWTTLRAWRAPRLIEVAIVLAATGGVALVVGVSPGEQIGLAGLAWGLASAIVTALYNLTPGPLYEREPANRVVTRAFVLAAIPMLPLLVLLAPEHLGLPALANVAFVALGGTALPFALYLTALDRVAALRANVIGTLEPVVAAVVSVAIGLATASASMALGIIAVVGAVVGASVVRARPAAPRTERAGRLR
jgi:drug/metabolite transporter (DMT)-like permease